jgi:hypothetical protein
LRKFSADSKGGVDYWMENEGRGVKLGKPGKAGKERLAKMGQKLAKSDRF